MKTLLNITLMPWLYKIDSRVVYKWNILKITYHRKAKMRAEKNVWVRLDLLKVNMQELFILALPKDSEGKHYTVLMETLHSF